MASNGQLAASELAVIPGSRESTDAAAAWNAPNGPAANGLTPSGYQNGYRDLATEWIYWNEYQAGTGNLAAYPGTSNHGWGKAIDVSEEWMRAWLDDHGARFGWKKTEAFSEWWHMNYVGGVNFPTFDTLKQGDSGKRVLWYAKRLAFIHKPGGHAYLAKPSRKFDHDMHVAVVQFQKAHDLTTDGVIGEKTAHRISTVFHKQYIAHKGKRKQSLYNATRERLAILRHGAPKPQKKE